MDRAIYSVNQILDFTMVQIVVIREYSSNECSTLFDFANHKWKDLTRENITLLFPEYIQYAHIVLANYIILISNLI